VNSGKKFPKDVIDCWPEIFGEITLNVIPLQYLVSVTVTFKNNKIWEIKVDNKVSTARWDSFEKDLKEMLSVYEKNVENVDFKIDTERLKKDIIKSTNRFFKKRKLR